MTALAWRDLGADWQPSADAADCIRVRLDLALADAQPDLPQHLSGPEQARAASYRSADARLAFVAGRIALRAVLAVVCRTSPALVALAQDDRGALSAPASGLHVSLTHGGNWLLLALSREPVGIDVEPVAAVPEWQLIADSFHAADRNRLAREPAAQVQPFLRCWTRREALGKALGVGLGFAPDACAVGCDVTAAPLSIAMNGDWYLSDADPDSCHVGCVACAADGILVPWSVALADLLLLVPSP